MPHEVLEDKLKPVLARIRRLEMDPRIGSAYVARGIEEATASMEAMKADWERQFSDKPTRKTRSDKGKPRKTKTPEVSDDS